MFTTMSGVGMLDDISASGIVTAFIVYPQAIVRLIQFHGSTRRLPRVLFLPHYTGDRLFSIVEAHPRRSPVQTEQEKLR